MKLPRILLVLLLLVPALHCRESPDPFRRGNSPDHVFFIVIDTLRADHLGCYGYPRPVSPTIDALARDGVIFERAFSSSSNTLEGVYSLFTSTTGLTNRVYHDGIPERYVPLQKLFAEGGFNTLAVIANPWLKFHEEFFADGFAHLRFVNQQGGEYWGANMTDDTSSIVFELMDRSFDSAGKNFFYIHYLDPHDAYRSPKDYGFYDGDPPEPLPSAHELSNEDETHREHARDPASSEIPRPRPVSEAVLRFLIASYDHEIRYVDEHIGRLLDHLDERGILEESLVVITSDHGEEFLDHGLLKHGFQLFDETIRVPLILYGPRFVGHGRESRVVSGIDLAPTLLESVGLEMPDYMLGQDLLDGDVKRSPAVFCTHFVNQQQRGVRTADWKIIENLVTGRRRLFDLRSDPDEQNDLYEAGDPRSTELFRALAEALARHAPTGDEPRGPDPTLDEETREQLRSLGYLQ